MPASDDPAVGQPERDGRPPALRLRHDRPRRDRHHLRQRQRRHAGRAGRGHGVGVQQRRPPGRLPSRPSCRATSSTARSRSIATATNAAGNPTPTPAVADDPTITTVAGDYTGVGKAGLAIYSPGTGDFTFAHAGTGQHDHRPRLRPGQRRHPRPGRLQRRRPDRPGHLPADQRLLGHRRQQPGVRPVHRLRPADRQRPAPTIIPAPADFDADGLTDPAVFTIVNVNGVGYGIFTILHNVVTGGQPRPSQSVAWGLAGDTPVSGDFDGSGQAQIAVYRPSTGTWYVRSSGAGGHRGRRPASRSRPSSSPPSRRATSPSRPTTTGSRRGSASPGGDLPAEHRDVLHLQPDHRGRPARCAMPKLPGQGAERRHHPGLGRLHRRRQGRPRDLRPDPGDVRVHQLDDGRRPAARPSSLTNRTSRLTAPEQYRAAATRPPPPSDGRRLPRSRRPARRPRRLGRRRRLGRSLGGRDRRGGHRGRGPDRLDLDGQGQHPAARPRPEPRRRSSSTTRRPAPPGPPRTTRPTRRSPRWASPTTACSSEPGPRAIATRRPTPRPTRRGVAARGGRRWRGRAPASTLVGSGRRTAPDRRAPDARLHDGPRPTLPDDRLRPAPVGHLADDEDARGRRPPRPGRQRPRGRRRQPPRLLRVRARQGAQGRRLLGRRRAAARPSRWSTSS